MVRSAHLKIPVLLLMNIPVLVLSIASFSNGQVCKTEYIPVLVLSMNIGNGKVCTFEYPCSTLNEHNHCFLMQW